MGSPFADDHGIMGKSHDFNIQLGGFHWLLIIIPIGIATTEGIPGHTQILVILVSYWVEYIPYPNINLLKFRYILRYTHSSRGYGLPFSFFFWGGGHENWTPPRSGWKITPRSISVGKVGKRLEAFKWLGSGIEVSSMAPQNMALYGTLPPF